MRAHLCCTISLLLYLGDVLAKFETILETRIAGFEAILDFVNLLPNQANGQFMFEHLAELPDNDVVQLAVDASMEGYEATGTDVVSYELDGITFFTLPRKLNIGRATSINIFKNHLMSNLAEYNTKHNQPFVQFEQSMLLISGLGIGSTRLKFPVANMGNTNKPCYMGETHFDAIVAVKFKYTPQEAAMMPEVYKTITNVRKTKIVKGLIVSVIDQLRPDIEAQAIAEEETGITKHPGEISVSTQVQLKQQTSPSGRIYWVNTFRLDVTKLRSSVLFKLIETELLKRVNAVGKAEKFDILDLGLTSAAVSVKITEAYTIFSVVVRPCQQVIRPGSTLPVWPPGTKTNE